MSNFHKVNKRCKGRGKIKTAKDKWGIGGQFRCGGKRTHPMNLRNHKKKGKK